MATSSTDNRPAIVVIAVIAILTSIMIFVALLSAQPPAPSAATPDRQVVMVTSPTATGSPSPRPTESTPGTTSPSATKTTATTATTATTSPSTTTTTTPAPQSSSIALEPAILDAQPFETVRLTGTYIGTNGPATLRVQHYRQASWVDFPLPVTTDSAGHFTAYVELGRPGINWLRVVEPGTKTASPVVLLAISG